MHKFNKICPKIAKKTINKNKTKLIDVNYFTFEPHISVLNSKYGYKKENIYYFVEGKLVEL